ncbi:hypothetical protein HHK36_004849 [Tetracentron sinense]|uniref:rRNA methylase n=1 Tax=Tetracentron sinense TaxID=13715 RepID=A0A834ZNB2_TETSI|nr:hypothetical protein HHK36_004849 [Tetracentron sinense]
MLSPRFFSHSLPIKETLIFTQTFVPFRRNTSRFSPLQRNFKNLSFCTRSIEEPRRAGLKSNNPSTNTAEESSPLAGLEDALMGYISGKKKATELAHLVWQHIIRKGDMVVDATCGNGHDTLAMLKMVADESGKGRVYGMDIQRAALENTTSLLDESLNPNEKETVELFPLCHSRMEDIVPKGTSVRLVAFNLGYLPGGDKAVTTVSETTLLALQAASRILGPGGLISIMVYVGHPGGREEFETVQDFASGLSVDKWVCWPELPESIELKLYSFGTGLPLPLPLTSSKRIFEALDFAEEELAPKCEERVDSLIAEHEELIWKWISRLRNFMNLGITGESYAGKYVPAIGYYILQQNSRLPVSWQVNLGGVAVSGAGHLVPADQALSSQAMIEDWVLERGLFSNDFRGYL